MSRQEAWLLIATDIGHFLKYFAWPFIILLGIEMESESTNGAGGTVGIIGIIWGICILGGADGVLKNGPKDFNSGCCC